MRAVVVTGISQLKTCIDFMTAEQDHILVVNVVTG